MAMHVGLLRAVNVAGHNSVAMSDLRGLLTKLGMQDVQSLLQSGNVVFQSAGRTPARLERTFEDAAKKQLGVETDFFVRTADEWRAVVARNPFQKEAERDPGHLLVMCLKAEPDPAAVAALQRAIKGREVVRAKGRHAYLVYPDGVGRSRLTSAVIERALGTRGTARNWNTVLKLCALAGATDRRG